MLKFITRFFAVIGFLVVALIGLAVMAASHAGRKLESEPSSVVLALNFDNPVVEQGDGSPLDLAMTDEPLVLLDILQAIDRAKDDPHVKGIVAHFGAEQPKLAMAQEIRDALARFRKSGKFTYAYGTDYGAFGSGNRAYYLASAFEEIWLQPVGSVSLTGLAIRQPFGKAALDKLGVTADFMQREEYKSLMEGAMRDGFSPPVKAEMQAMLGDIENQIASGIGDSRKMDPAHVKELMAQGPYTAEEAKQAGLITRIAYADELDDALDAKAGKEAAQADPATYLAYEDAQEKDVKETTVAVIYGTGLIMDKAIGGAGLTGEEILDAGEIAGAFNDAADDKDVKAILFRIDSPGGSPSASETIRRAITRAQKKGKPVIVSMGDTAASGGYWVAMNGDRIVADPATLTGSIGVVAGKFADNGLMQKLGVSVDGVATADNAAMWMPVAPFNPAQRARVNAMLDDTYHTFVSNVSAARKIPMEKMPDIAKGRVWTGAQAAQIGLVDDVGGYDKAMDAVRKSLKIGDDVTLSLETFPAPPSPTEKIMKLLRRFGAESAAAASAAAWLGHVQAAFAPWLAAVSRAPVEARLGVREVFHD